MVMDEALRLTLARHLAGFERQGGHPGGGRAAAVALVIVEEGMGAAFKGLVPPTQWSSEAAMIMTRRVDTLRKHSGQWALPGGRIDPGESAEQAALRELAEEVGLYLQPEAVLGRLDDFVSHSGFAITPVVIWAGATGELEPNPGEVESIHRIRLSEFMREDAPHLEAIADAVHPILRMPVGDWRISAPTGAVLYQFREVCLCGRPTRVAHYEQPLFARK